MCVWWHLGIDHGYFLPIVVLRRDVILTSKFANTLQLKDFEKGRLNQCDSRGDSV